MFHSLTFFFCFIIKWLLVFFLKLPEMTTSSSSSSELMNPGTGSTTFWSASLGRGLGVGRYLGKKGRVRKEME